MANVTSGSFNTSSKNNRYLQFSWTCTQNTSKNESTINWKLVCKGTASGYNKSAPFSVTIDGEEVYYSSTRIQLWVGTEVASGSKVIKHNANGSRSFTASAKAAIYDAGYNVSGSGSWDLKPIPRAATITDAPNFNDTDNPTITYSNSQGNNVTSLQACLSFDGSTANIAYRDISKTGTSYTFNFTEAEREVLRKGCTTANSKSIYFYIKTVVDGVTFYERLSKTLTIQDGSVTLSPTVQDTNSRTIALTGDANKLIKYYSNIEFDNGEVARKHATITERTLTNGALSATTAKGELYSVESNSFVFYAKDSRGNQATRTITPEMIDYVKLTCDLIAKPELAEDNTTTIKLNVSGLCYNGSFGAQSNVTHLWYRYKAEGEEWGDEWISITPTFNGNSYTSTAEIKNLDYRTTYIVQAIAQDKIFLAYENYKTSPEIAVKTEPAFDWSGEDFNFNVPLYYQGKAMDFVIEYGETNGWRWRKWHSGIGECWKILTHTSPMTIAWGSLYCTSMTSRQNYPFPFKNKPVENVSLCAGSSAGWIYPEYNGNGVNGGYASACYAIARPSAVTSSQTFYLSFYVIGEYQ